MGLEMSFGYHIGNIFIGVIFIGIGLYAIYLWIKETK